MASLVLRRANRLSPFLQVCSLWFIAVSAYSFWVDCQLQLGPYISRLSPNKAHPTQLSLNCLLSYYQSVANYLHEALVVHSWSCWYFSPALGISCSSHSPSVWPCTPPGAGESSDYEKNTRRSQGKDHNKSIVCIWVSIYDPPFPLIYTCLG